MMGALRFQSHPSSSGGAAELYGFINQPKGQAQADQGVLLCNPFGQEAVRVHRLYRVLGERLARAGVASLRFDYFGTGDSDGDDDELSVQSGIDNILRADDELRSQAGCQHVSWFGLRLGATLAALASARAKRSPDRLFLWDPIETGSQWLALQRQEHDAALITAFDETSRMPTNPAGQAATEAPFEAQGYLLGQPLIEAMRQFKVDDYLSIRCARLVVMAAGEAQQQRLALLERARHIHSLESHRVTATHWNTDEAMNAAIVPNDIVDLVLTEMAGGGR